VLLNPPDLAHLSMYSLSMVTVLAPALIRHVLNGRFVEWPGCPKCRVLVANRRMPVALYRPS
jgi:hypothetical protein